MRVLLVRHGQSEWNASHRLQGQADVGLTETGRRQADELQPVIETIRPCRALSSDLKRVRETATRIGAPNPQFTDRLREIDVGDWTGRSIAEIRSEDPEGYLGWRAGTTTPVGGESWSEFSARVCTVIEEERQMPCENLLVVCHGGVIRAILQHFLGLGPENIIAVAPASLTAVRMSNGADRQTRLELFNYRPEKIEFEAPD